MIRKPLLITGAIFLAAAVVVGGAFTAQWVKLRQTYSPKPYVRRIMRELTAIVRLTPEQAQTLRPLLFSHRETLTAMDRAELDAWAHLFASMANDSPETLTRNMAEVDRVDALRNRARLQILLKARTLFTAEQRAAYSRLMLGKINKLQTMVNKASRP